MPTSLNSKTVFMPKARSKLSISKASASKSSSRARAYRSSLLGMEELRNDWKKVAMAALYRGVRPQGLGPRLDLGADV
jgi:hypothetical protein